MNLNIDREPVGPLELATINGFQNVPAVDSIWVRHSYTTCPPDVPYMVWLAAGYASMEYRVYLGTHLADPRSRELADRVFDELRHRAAAEDATLIMSFFDIKYLPLDRPAKIWQRPPTIWLPRERDEL